MYIFVYNIIEYIVNIREYRKEKQFDYIRSEYYDITWNILGISVAICILLICYGIIVLRFTA